MKTSSHDLSNEYKMTFLHLHDKIMMLVANGVQLQSYLSNACGRNFCQRPCGVTRCDVCIGWTYNFPMDVFFGGEGGIHFVFLSNCLFCWTSIYLPNACGCNSVNIHAD